MTPPIQPSAAGQASLDERHREYFQYLVGRGQLGKLYRRYLLYPRLCRYLTGRVADVGCGIGDFLHSRPNTTGFDVNPYLVGYCNRQGLSAQLIVSGKLPATDECFDGAVLDNVLEHLEDPVPTLLEIRRVLRPEGTLIVGVPGPAGYAAGPDHKRYYDEQALREIVAVVGFRYAESLHLPLRSAWVSKRMKQYCVYGVLNATMPG